MTFDDRLTQRYADLLEDDDSADIQPVIAALDAALEPQRQATPPASLDTNIEKELDHFARRRGSARRERRTTAEIGPPAAPSLPQPLPPALQAPPEMPADSRRWRRQAMEMVAAAVVLVMLAGVLALALNGRMPATQQVGGQPPATTPLPASGAIWDTDPRLKRLRAEGMGRDLNLTQTRHGFTMTLRWAVLDAGRLAVYYTIGVPGSLAISSLNAAQPTLTAADGTPLPYGLEGGGAVVDGVSEGIAWFDAFGVRAGDELDLTLRTPALRGLLRSGVSAPLPPGVVITTPTSAGSSSPTFAIPSEGRSPSSYIPGPPITSITIDGPFIFDFSVPVPADHAATVANRERAPKLTMQQASAIARDFRGDPSATFSGELMFGGPLPGPSTIANPPYPNAQLYLLTWEWKTGAYPDCIVIDANTGDVLLAFLPSRGDTDGAQATPSPADLRRTATAFARDHFAGFDLLQLVEDPVLALDHRYLSGAIPSATPSAPLRFRWRERDAETGVWLDRFVTVDVDRYTGEVTRYIANYTAGPTPAPATVSRDAASQRALQAASDTYDSPDAQVVSVDLATLPFDDPARLVWAVTLNGNKIGADGANQRLRLLIDAHTGVVVESGPAG